MPGQARKFDTTLGVCNHGLPCCPHTISGIIMDTSTDCDCNGQGMARQDDMTMHTCPHCPNGYIMSSSGSKKVNNKGGAREGDTVNETHGTGIITSGSKDTMVG